MSSASARGNNKDAFINPYELQKIAQCARNQKKFESLKIAQCARNLMQPIQPRKRIKKTQGTRDAAPNNHNLRPRSERTSSEIAIANEEIADCETIGDFLGDNEDLHSNTQKKRKGGRSVSRMDDILLKEPGSMPKIKIELNGIGQPIGENYRKLSSVIGVQTRKMLPVGCSDWRLVDAEKKIALWADIKKRFDIDDKALDWVMSSAGAKWKQFKTKLKQQIFDETLTDEELKNLHGHRIDEHELDSLLKYWRSHESQVLATRGKDNRAKLKFLHTSGSVSYASAAHKLGEQLGRPPRRDEVYIKTHTRKNGVPLRPATSTIAGNEVILFAMSSDEKVAKGTIVSVNPNNKLAGEALGMKFCEVIVNVVLRRETLVPRPYADIKTLGDAVKMPVAWPFNRLKVCSHQPRSSQSVAGSSQRSSQGAAGSSQRC